MDIDDLLAEARTLNRVAPAPLLGQVLADAYALQPQPGPKSAAPAEVGPGFFARMFGGAGGVGGLAGLGMAALGGVWVGFAQPDMIVPLADMIWQGAAVDSVELIPDFDTFLAEG